MIKNYVIDTKEQSDACRQGCYTTHMSAEPDEEKRTIIALTTTQWSEGEYRESDGKFIVPYCEHYGNPDNYPIEEVL